MRLIAILSAVMLFFCSSWAPTQASALPQQEVAIGMPAKVKFAEATLVQISLHVSSVDLQDAITKYPALKDDPAVKLVQDNQGTWLVGTGFLVNNLGDAITADHVIRDLESVKQRLEFLGFHPRAQLELPRPSFEKGGLTMIGSMLTFVLRIKAEDKDHDLALITSEDNQAGLQKLLQGDQFMVKYYDVHPLPVKLHSTRVVDGDEIIAVGFPLGETSPISSSGHIASAWSMENLVNANETGSDKSTEVYTLDLRINPGNSGGPLFLSQDMSVIGIIVELKNGPGGIAKAVRSSYIEKFLTDNKVSYLKSPPSAP